MNPSHKKDLIAAYKQQKRLGGVYTVRCTDNQKQWIECTPNMEGMKNRFNFCVSTNVCIYHALQADWSRLGSSAFQFEVLESLPQKEDISPADYQEELRLLRDCLRAEVPAELQYQ